MIKIAQYDVALEDWLNPKFPEKMPDSEVASTVALTSS
jgi:hypothetical protein